MQQNTISATEARVHFGEVIRRAYASQEELIVEKDGIPVVVILSFPYYKELMRELKLARFKQASAVAGQEAEQAGLTEEALESQLESLRAEVYRQKYG